MLKRKLVIGIVMAMIMTITINIAYASSYCYQEYADVADDCGSSANGFYSQRNPDYWVNYENVIDGDYNTFGYLNETIVPGSVDSFSYYAKPSNATNNNTKWQYKDFSGTYNYTVSDNCWNYNSTHMLFISRSYEDEEVQTTEYYCVHDPEFESSEFLAVNFDGNQIYEEGIWWNMTHDADAPTDSCTYGGSGDWEITMSDNCDLTTDTDVNGKLKITGDNGLLEISSKITANSLYIEPDDFDSDFVILIKNGGSLSTVKN